MQNIICEICKNKEKLENTKKENFEETSDNEDDIYTPIFNTYQSIDDFIGKNLVSLNNLKEYITEKGKVNWNLIMLNKKKNDKLLEQQNNYTWMKAMSQINFVNDLISISSYLTYFPTEDRQQIFKDLINHINKEYLPCKLYDPLSIKDLNYNINSDKLLSIEQNYSHSINTKERVPCLMLLKFETSRKIYEDKSENSSKNGSDKHLYLTGNNSERNSTGSNNNITGRKTTSHIPRKMSKSMKKMRNYFTPNVEQSYYINLENCKIDDFEEGSMFGKYTFREVKYKLIEKELVHREKNQIENNNENIENNIDVISFIVKGNDEVRCDYFVDQVISLFKYFFKSNKKAKIFLSNCCILSNGYGGIIQTIVDSISLSKINKIVFKSNTNNKNILLEQIDYNEEKCCNLKKYFYQKFGYNTKKYDNAITNFISSLAGYSLLCYFLEIRDRNNGNILIDSKGHLIHIDFAFILNRSPGNMEFEKAPFKITDDFIELLQNDSSFLFMQFQDLFFEGFKCIRNQSDIFIAFVEIYCHLYKDLEAFKGTNSVITKIKDKFFFNINDESLLKDKCNQLIKSSIGNWRTDVYDSFQRYCVGV